MWTSAVCDQAPSLEPRTSLGGPSEKDRPAPTQTIVRGPDALPSPTKPGTLLTESSRVTNPTPDARAPSAVSPSDSRQPDTGTDNDEVQRQARVSWYAEASESPDVTVRLQALEFWAQQPGDGLDPVTYALMDEDEEVRARAQDLYAQQLAQEATAEQP